MPSLESVLHDLEADSDIIINDIEPSFVPTPTPSLDDPTKTSTFLRHVILNGVTSQVSSAVVRY